MAWYKLQLTTGQADVPCIVEAWYALSLSGVRLKRHPQCFVLLLGVASTPVARRGTNCVLEVALLGAP